jgi:hypothetical protein
MLALVNTSAWGNNVYLDNINISNTAGLEEQVKNSGFKVYPNPTTGDVFVELNTVGTALVKVSDLTGRVVKSETVENTGSRFPLDLSGQASGTYFLEVKVNCIAYQQKVTVIK